MKILFYDTETTGLFPKHKDYSRLDEMPRLIQLGYAAYESVNGQPFKCRREMGKLVCPQEEFEIGESAFNAHGISKADVIAGGSPTNVVLDNFLKAVEWADVLVCHNVWFDKTLVNSEIQRYKGQFEDANALLKAKHFCTMQFLTPLIKLPSPYGRGFKFPKLEEAMKFFFGRGVEGAHDALNDVRATVEVFFEIQKRYPEKFNNAINE